MRKKPIQHSTQISTRPRATYQGRVKCRRHPSCTVPAVPTQGAIPEEGGYKKKPLLCALVYLANIKALLPFLIVLVYILYEWKYKRSAHLSKKRRINTKHTYQSKSFFSQKSFKSSKKIFFKYFFSFQLIVLEKICYKKIFSTIYKIEKKMLKKNWNRNSDYFWVISIFFSHNVIHVQYVICTKKKYFIFKNVHFICFSIFNLKKTIANVNNHF